MNSRLKYADISGMKHQKIAVFAFIIAAMCVPYNVSAQTTVPALEDFRQEGIASMYGNEFNGRPTASGEIFDSTMLTAAHPSLPFGTFLLVTNKNNNRQVVVRVNDRGPFIAGRIIDLSRAAAEILRMVEQGIVPVTIETVQVGRQHQPPAPLAVQVPVTPQPPAQPQPQTAPQPVIQPPVEQTPVTPPPPPVTPPPPPVTQPPPVTPPPVTQPPPVTPPPAVQSPAPPPAAEPPSVVIVEPQQQQLPPIHAPITITVYAPPPQIIHAPPAPAALPDPSLTAVPQAQPVPHESLHPQSAAAIIPRQVPHEPPHPPSVTEISTHSPQELPPPFEITEPVPAQPAWQNNNTQQQQQLPPPPVEAPPPAVVYQPPPPVTPPPPVELPPPAVVYQPSLPQQQQLPPPPVEIPPVVAMLPPPEAFLPPPVIYVAPPPVTSGLRLIPPITPQPDKVYRLQVGSYRLAQNAVGVFTRLKEAGLNPGYDERRDGDIYRVILPGIRGRDVASVLDILDRAGFIEVIIREE